MAPFPACEMFSRILARLSPVASPVRVAENLLCTIRRTMLLSFLVGPALTVRRAVPVPHLSPSTGLSLLEAPSGKRSSTFT